MHYYIFYAIPGIQFSTFLCLPFALEHSTVVVQPDPQSVNDANSHTYAHAHITTPALAGRPDLQPSKFYAPPTYIWVNVIIINEPCVQTLSRSR